MISHHEPAPRSADTTPPMVSASFIAGITIDTVESSAKKTLDDPVPGDRLRNGSPRPSKACSKRSIGGQTVDGFGNGGRIRAADEPVDPVVHELQRSAGIA